MAAIAGWVDHARDLSDGTDGAAVAGRMLAALRVRGAAGSATRAFPAALLAHRWADGAGTTGEPAVLCVDGQPRACLVADAEIDNLAAVRSHLLARGYRLPGTATSDVLLAGWLEWGTGLAEQLVGRYAIGLWDAGTGEGVLIRDRLGGRPLHYHAGPHGVLFASTPDAILASGLVEAAIDLDGLREMLGFVKTPGTGYFQGIREVPPGHLVRIGPAGVTSRRYWALAAAEHRADPDAAATAVRELLDQAVRRVLADGEPPTALLSGLDSAAITALAAPAVRERTGATMRSLSVHFGLTVPGVRPAPPRDSPLYALAAQVGTEHSAAVVNGLRLTLPATRAAAAAARSAPPLGEFDTSVYLIFQEVGRRTGLALSGDGADELFGGYYWSHEPASVHAGTFPWTDLIASHDRFAALLTPELVGALNLPDYRADRYAEAIAQVPALPSDSPLQRRMRELDHLHLTRFLPMVLDRTERMAAAGGVRVRTPFADHDLAQYLFNVPWSTKVRNGHKSLLRAATRELTPAAAVAARPSDHRGAAAATNLPYHQSLCVAVRDLLTDPAAPVRALLHLPAVTAALELEPAAAALTRMETELELVLGLNDWLGQHRPRLVL